MSRRPRIGVIYRKELLDILRDRRTILAMIVVPVVLYPLLMLGFLRAAESGQDKLKAERYVVEVSDEATRTRLVGVISTVARHPESPDQKPPEFDVRVGHTQPQQLGEAVQARMELTIEDTPDPLPPRFKATITYSEVNVRSRAALDQLTDLFNRLREILTRESLTDILGGEGRRVSRSVDILLRPVEVNTISAATERQRGGWALGQIVPVILVLMTITGAVYPAIDLTAGERERGTLETLMATPVSPLHLITGKFLVVATVSLMAAVLNVASVGATMHFGGVTKALTSEMPVSFPLSVLPIMLLCMVPFALLFSAILVAVCSFARTFKEAQNYVMPVIIISMVPAIAVTLPTVQLRGIMLVMPVGNMVLLARELFQQTYEWTQVAVVLVSTTLYAAAAVTVAAKLFGQEAVLFADSRSYRAMLARRYYEPRSVPAASQALLMAALLFPASFYTQSLLSAAGLDRFVRMMGVLAVVQFLGLLVVVPLAFTGYFKICAARTFRLCLPRTRAWLAAAMLGVSSWVIAHELFALQSRIMSPSRALTEAGRQIEAQIESAPAWLVVLLLAVVPGIAEEFFFRGFLLSGLGGSLRKWPALLLAAMTFGTFHFIIDKVPVTMALGVMLGYLCWQSGSIFPAMLTHAMHNGLATMLPRVHRHWPTVAERLGIGVDLGAGQHLPALTIVAGVAIFATAIAILVSTSPLQSGSGETARRSASPPSEP